MLTWPWGDGGSSWAGRAEGPSPLTPLKIKVTAELCGSGDEVRKCTPAWNKQRLGSDSKFFSRESRRKGHHSLALGQCCTFPGEPAWTALLPLGPSKMKVTAEVCCSGTEVGTYPPARNKQQLGSDLKLFFEGKSEEGPSLLCSGAVLHCPWRACTDGPSPAPSLENESRDGGPLFWG